VEFVRKASELARVLVGLADFANTNPEYSEFPVLIKTTGIWSTPLA